MLNARIWIKNGKIACYYYYYYSPFLTCTCQNKILRPQSLSSKDLTTQIQIFKLDLIFEHFSF